jgi:hypothetical protein
MRYHKPYEDDDSNPYLPIRCAADIARLDLSSIYDALRDGRLKYVLVAPHTARVRLSDLNDFLSKRNGQLSAK